MSNNHLSCRKQIPNIGHRRHLPWKRCRPEMPHKQPLHEQRSGTRHLMNWINPKVMNDIANGVWCWCWLWWLRVVAMTCRGTRHAFLQYDDTTVHPGNDRHSSTLPRWSCCVGGFASGVMSCAIADCMMNLSWFVSIGIFSDFDFRTYSQSNKDADPFWNWAFLCWWLSILFT